MNLADLRILIVEDDPMVVDALRYFIEGEGHTVCGVVGDSRAVIQAIEGASPDIIFMDLYLEDGARGLELTRHITSTQNLPVIILSGISETDAMLEKLPESGALSFLEKPFSSASLRMNLRIAVRHHMLQKSLAESEEKYRTIYNNAAMGIYLACPEGTGSFLLCNQAFAGILGYDNPDELLGLLRNKDEQLYEQPGRRQELLALLREKGTVSGFESEVFGRDGELLWISESCTPIFNAAGELLHYQGVVSDITARKHAEEAFRTTYNLLRMTIDSLREALLVTDLAGHLIMANSAAEALLGQQLEEGEKLPFLVALPLFARFQNDFAPQVDAVDIHQIGKPVHYKIVPYKNAADTVIGAVHLLAEQRQSPTA